MITLCLIVDVRPVAHLEALETSSPFITGNGILSRGEASKHWTSVLFILLLVKRMSDSVSGNDLSTALHSLRATCRLFASNLSVYLHTSPI